MRIPSPREYEALRKARHDTTKEAAEQLYERGWFISLDWPTHLPGDMLAALRTAPEEVDDWLIGFFAGCIDDVHRRICEAFPDRCKVISEAFEAHKQGKYSLSVPVMLAQSD